MIEENLIINSIINNFNFLENKFNYEKEILLNEQFAQIGVNYKKGQLGFLVTFDRREKNFSIRIYNPEKQEIVHFYILEKLFSLCKLPVTYNIIEKNHLKNITDKSAVCVKENYNYLINEFQLGNYPGGNNE